MSSDEFRAFGHDIRRNVLTHCENHLYVKMKENILFFFVKRKTTVCKLSLILFGNILKIKHFVLSLGRNSEINISTDKVLLANENREKKQDLASEKERIPL